MKPKTQAWKTRHITSFMAARYIGSFAALGMLAIQSSTAAITTWTGSGGDLNWASAGNWNNGLPAGNDVIFSNAAATGTIGASGTENNNVGAAMTISSLRFNNLSSTGFHTTQINAGVTLSVTGGNAGTTTTANPNVFVNSPTTGKDDVVYATIKGGGKLLLNNINANLNVGQGTLTSGTDNAASNIRRATLDMAGLEEFQATLGRLIIGQQSVVGNRPNGTIKLAKTNVIDLANTTLPGLILGEIGSNNGTSQILELGTTNTILTDTGIAIGGRKGNASMLFNADMLALGDGLATFRSRNGTGRQAQWLIGDNSAQSTGGTSATGLVDFTGGKVDALVNHIILGRGNSNANNTPLTQGTLTLDEGSINADQLSMGFQGGAVTGPSKGTLNVLGSGNLLVSGAVTLGRVVSGGTYNSWGELNIDGQAAAVTFLGDVLCGSGSGNKITLSDGLLSLAGKVGDTTDPEDFPLETLDLNGGTLDFNFGSAANPAGASANVTGLNVGGPVAVSVSGTNLSPGTIPLIKYNTMGGSAGFGGLSLSLPLRVNGTLVDNSANGSVDLQINGVFINKWSGAINGNWDIDSTSNWQLSPGNSPSTYLQPDIPGEKVVFDDTASGTKSVNLTTVLSPAGIAVNTAQTYSFTGGGAIGGPTEITKQGSGTLVLANTGMNSFSGGLAIEGGTFRLGSADRLPANTAVSLTNAAGVLFELNNFNTSIASLAGGGSIGGNVALGSATLDLTGSGDFAGMISGVGSLAKSGTGTQVLSAANSYGGGTTVSGGRLAIANTSGSGAGSGPVVVEEEGVLAFGSGDAAIGSVAGTMTNNGRVAFNSTSDFTFEKLIQGTGSVAKENTSNTVTLNGANTHTGDTFVFGGGLRITHPDALGTTDGLTNINNGATSRLEIEGGISLAEPFTIACKGAAVGNVPAVVNVSGNNTMSGPITLGGGGSFWTFLSEDGKLTVSGTMTNTNTVNTRTIRLRGQALGEIQSPISNSAGDLSPVAVLKEEGGTWTLSGVNPYTGPTTVDGGTLLVNGSNSASSVTVNPSGTLGGTGSVATVTASGTIAPGSATSPIGTLSAGNTTLTGLLAIEVSGVLADRLNVTGTLALSLATVSVAGTPTASSYTLAQATSITGVPVLEAEVPGYELVVDGNLLKLNSTSQGTPFTTWAALNNLSGDAALPATDVENDGLSNLLEFVLGGNPNANDNPSVRPVVQDNGANITLTFKRSNESKQQPVAVKVQVSANLGTWSASDETLIGATAGSGPDGVTYTVTAVTGGDLIVVTIPKNGAAKKFARVQAVIP